MTPVLLDQGSILKAGITVSLGMLVVFSCGYYLGHQKAVGGSAMELNQTIALALPRPAHADTEEYEPQQPQSLAPGAHIDVDSPDEASARGTIGAEASVQPPYAQAGVDAVIKQTTDSIESAAGEATAEPAGQPLQLASLEPSAAVFGNGSDTALSPALDQSQRAAETEANASPAIIDTAAAEDARYTIQVGVFANADNALRRVSELEALQLSAYTNNYTNKRDEMRFNVGFGYFNNKSSALAALEVFEKQLSGSGYVKRIRRN